MVRAETAKSHCEMLREGGEAELAIAIVAKFAGLSSTLYQIRSVKAATTDSSPQESPQRQ